MAFLVLILQALLVSAWVILLVRVVLSWVDPRYQRPIARSVYSLTEPFLAPIRRVLPSTGMLDLSPLILLLGLGLVLRIVLAA
jgi:YggT family protein